MKEEQVLPISLKLENRIGIRQGVLLAVVMFLLVGLPWVIGNMELFRQEGVYAAIAAEYADNQWDPADGITAKAHGVILDDAWPLYPAVTALLYRFMPMEMALRVLSILMLGFLSLLVGIATALRSNKRAGLVAACCCCGTIFAMDKGVFGGPAAMAACFLLLAQLLFFHYGSRYADWNSAWIAAAIFLSLGFVTAGPVVVIFFIFPLLFLRRPLSFAGKFRTPGFWAGLILLLIVVLTWAYPFGINFRIYADNSQIEMVPMGRYMQDVLMFPVEFILRMFPWSLLMWIPFCVALQAISPVPVFCRYLRTLFFSMLALAWLMPGASSILIFFLVGPLAILTGLNYELGIRRYGIFIRSVLTFCGGVFPVLTAAILGIVFLPDWILKLFTNSLNMSYRFSEGYFYLACSAVGLLIILAFIFAVGRRRLPIWVQILLLSCGICIFVVAEILPYRMMQMHWRVFGNDVRRVLPENIAGIYKYEIEGMHSGLFYAGVPVKKLRNLNELDKLEDTVYIISSQVPVYPDRVWTSLLPEGYTCLDVEVSVWRGIRREEDYGSIAIDE